MPARRRAALNQTCQLLLLTFFTHNMSRLEDETQDLLRSVLKADEYARLQAQQTAQKRAYRQGRRPKK